MTLDNLPEYWIPEDATKLAIIFRCGPYSIEEIEDELDLYDIDIFSINNIDVFDIKGYQYVVLTKSEINSLEDTYVSNFMDYLQDEFRCSVNVDVYNKFNRYINYTQMLEELYDSDIEDILNELFEYKVSYVGHSDGYYVYSVN